MRRLVSAGWLSGVVGTGGAAHPVLRALGAEVDVLGREQARDPFAQVASRTQEPSLLDWCWRWRACKRTTQRPAHHHSSQVRFMRELVGAGGWQVARFGQILGDASRSASRPGQKHDRLPPKLPHYLIGLAWVEASLLKAKVGQ